MSRVDSTNTDAVLELEGVSFHYARRFGLFGNAGSEVAALNNVSLQVGRGEVAGLVGESGSGKSTIARCAVQLLSPQQGTIRFNGHPISHHQSGGDAPPRQGIQMVFQDSAAALSPRRTIRQSLLEPLAHFNTVPQVEWADEISRAMKRVGLDAELLPRLPSQLSSGQLQRVGIARAILARPDLIIADESVSALDVSVQAHILKLIRTLCDEQGISFLFISHDLAVMAQVADTIAVMYRGRVVESGPASSMFERPAHPYTRALLAAVPDPDPAAGFRPAKESTISRQGVQAGCPYTARCESEMPMCSKMTPQLMPLEDHPGHHVECFLYHE